MPMDVLTPSMGCSENKDEVNGGGEDVDQATKYVFSVEKRDLLSQHMRILQSGWSAVFHGVKGL